MAYVDQDEYPQSATFQKKIRVAMIKAALAVVGEDQSGMVAAGAAKRHELGVNILNDPAAYEMRFRQAVAADPGGAGVSPASSDNDILFTVNSVFNDIAGLTLEEATVT